MNSHFKQKLLAGLVVGMAAATAMAQTTTTPSTSATPTAAATETKRALMYDKATFDRLDTNKDGRISREEAQADPMLKDTWSKLDAENKGAVSQAEFEAYGRKLNPNSADPKAAPFSGTEPKK